MIDSELKKKYGELYVHIEHLQRYLERCNIALEKQRILRDCFILDDKDLELLIACLRIIKEEIHDGVFQKDIKEV